MPYATRYLTGTPLAARRSTAIHAPGPRLFRALPLRFIARRSGHGRRGIAFELNLTSMIDYLVIVTVFLLAQFATAPECCALHPSDLPTARSAHEIASAPIVSVTSRAIMLDGQRVATPAEVAAQMPLEHLTDRLMDARRNYPLLHPSEPFEGNLVLQVERGVAWSSLRHVLTTASAVGYVTPQFVVNRGVVATHPGVTPEPSAAP